jgi:transcriptional regulator with XRE-family HTH domain
VGDEEEVGRKIEALRTNAGLGQKELSERLRAAGVNWSQGTLSKVENGSRPIRFTEAIKVAQVLGVTTNELQPSGGALDRHVQRARWALSTATSAYRDARFYYLNHRDHYAALRLAQALLNGEQGPFRIHASAFDFLKLAVSDPASGRETMEEMELLELLGVDADELERLRQVVIRQARERAKSGAHPFNDAAPEGDAVFQAMTFKASLFTLKDDDNEPDDWLVDSDVIHRYGEELLTRRFPQLAFAPELRLEPPSGGEHIPLSVRKPLIVEGLSNLGEIDE